MKFAASGGALLALVLTLAGCDRGQDPVGGPAARARADSVSAIVGSIRLGVLREAYGRLSELAHERRVHTEQLDAQGEVIASASRIFRQTQRGGEPVIVGEPQGGSGAFQFGWFGRFAGEPGGDAEPFPVDEVIPEEPAFFSARSRDDFTYRLLSPVRLGSRVVQVLEVRARTGERNQPLRHVRVYFDPVTREALAMTINRVNPALLFRERSSVHVQLRPAGRGWVPDRTWVDARMHLLWSPVRRFRIVTEYLLLE